MHIVPEDVLPWYRQIWPWLLISLPAATVIAAIATIVIAIESNDGLVADDYYKQGLAIHRNAAQTQAARTMGVIADLRFDRTRRQVRVFLTHPAPMPASLSLTIRHPTIAGHDQQIQLQRAPDGSYAGFYKALAAAHWQVSLLSPLKEWRLDDRLPGDTPTDWRFQ